MAEEQPEFYTRKRILLDSTQQLGGRGTHAEDAPDLKHDEHDAPVPEGATEWKAAGRHKGDAADESRRH